MVLQLAESNQKSNKESLGDGKPDNKLRMTAPRMSSKSCIRAMEDVGKDRKVFFQSDSDILWEILCRLPIEGLLRCRCVCKTWYSVIKNPVFISLHMKISSIQPPRFIIETIQDSPFNANHLLLWDTEDGKTRKMPIEENLHAFRRIKFSHNGLLCIATSSCYPVVICNPITKERIELPPTNNEKHVNFPRIGFCFVPERQKHIVVQALYRHPYQPIKFYVLASGQHSWRLLTSPPSINGKYLLGDTIYWNNAFHWCVNKVFEGPGHECILSFDTIRETFQIISFPDAHHGWCVNLLVLNGRLSLIEKLEEKMKVWEVTGDKVGGFSLACRHIGTNKYSLVSRLLKNENLLASDCLGLLRSGNVVASNDLKQYKALKIDGVPSSFYASSYNPSLVSVYSMGFS